ncbi:hypothetical protein ELI_14695 [Erythrobacter litoralis HTCC2594]|uniref:Uncharacterized protein n=1 Tax=Erythrobacter litoralis (strain HTCC2594) TaxID=314225 RepID=Q2N5L0_ERYLH|nr:hypothetical protein ELI_14695 [Erythrobacter litoralis HTCC2594]
MCAPLQLLRPILPLIIITPALMLIAQGSGLGRGPRALVLRAQSAQNNSMRYCAENYPEVSRLVMLASLTGPGQT